MVAHDLERKSCAIKCHVFLACEGMYDNIIEKASRIGAKGFGG